MSPAKVTDNIASSQVNSDHEAEPSLNVDLLKELAKKGLIDSLNSVNGAKTLVLDSGLAGPLGLITDVSLLKQHGVDKMFWLESGPLSANTSNIVYLCRPKLKHIKVIADQIKRHTRESQKHIYTLLLVPRVSTLVSRILEEEGVLGEVIILPFNLQFIPIADDVISLEMDDAFKELWVDGDETVIFDSAQALFTLQSLYGRFPRIVGTGDHASRLGTLLIRPRATDSGGPGTAETSTQRIDSLIVLDRKVDMITPFLTQLTYEGLIDELIGIKNSHVELPVSLLTPPTAPNPNQPPSSTAAASTSSAAALSKEKKRKHHLTSETDPLYAELRDSNFASVGKKLNTVAHRLDEDYKARHQAKTVTQLKDFVGKLGGLQTEHQALRLHTGLSEMLVPLTRTDQFNKSLEVQQNLLASYDVSGQISSIEDMIAQGADLQVVLRLLCLLSITTGGIKNKTLENFKREILQTYGFKHLPLLLSLASPSLAILLPTTLSPSLANTPASHKYPYTSLRKPLRLLIDDDPQALDEVDNDISFTYSGYAPISIRLVQCVAQKGGVISNPADREKKGDAASKDRVVSKAQAHPIVGWKGFEDVLTSMPGETFDLLPNLPKGADPTAQPVAATLQSHAQPTTTVVFFLGGCTYTEIAALRWVAQQNRGRKYLIATTGIVSGESIIDGIAGAARGAEGREAGL